MSKVVEICHDFFISFSWGGQFIAQRVWQGENNAFYFQVDNAEPEESATVDFIKKLWYNIIGGAKIRPARDVRSLFDFYKKIWYNKMGTFFLYIKML
jgi:hypothetical protein